MKRSATGGCGTSHPCYLAGWRARATEPRLPQGCWGAFPPGGAPGGRPTRDRQGLGARCRGGSSGFRVPSQRGGADRGRSPSSSDILLLLAAGPARAQCTVICTVATAAELVSALTTVDTTPGTYTINITTNITLDCRHHLAGDHRQRQQRDHQRRSRHHPRRRRPPARLLRLSGHRRDQRPDHPEHRGPGRRRRRRRPPGAAAPGWAVPCSWPPAPACP